MKAHIHFLVAGGTIDSIFDGPRDMIVPYSETLIPGYLKRVVRPDFTFSCETIALKDSRDITDADRQAMVSAITSTNHQKIVITHGTYTMPETLNFIQDKIGNQLEKCVIITGSMLPLEGFAPSDAGFNLGFAIASAFSIEKGMYLCMNGRLFEPGEAVKKVDFGKFVVSGSTEN